MKSTTINMMTLFVPLLVGLVLFLAGNAKANCCWVGGCAPGNHTCNPCVSTDICGHSGSCAASYCNHHVMEGVLSPDSIARKLNQAAVEMRKAEQALEDRKADADHKTGDQDKFVRKSNIMNLFDMPKEALQERKVDGKFEKKATAEDILKDRNVDDQAKAQNIEA